MIRIDKEEYNKIKKEIIMVDIGMISYPAKTFIVINRDTETVIRETIKIAFSKDGEYFKVS